MATDNQKGTNVIQPNLRTDQLNHWLIYSPFPSLPDRSEDSPEAQHRIGSS